MGYTPLVKSLDPFSNTIADGIRDPETITAKDLPNEDNCFDSKQENGEWPYGTCLSQGDARSEDYGR